MKILNVAALAKELGLNDTFVQENLTVVISRLENSNRHYILSSNEKNKQVVKVTEEDLKFIESGVGSISFMDLSLNFDIPTRDLNWVLPAIADRSYIEKKDLEYYTDVKNKPAVKAWFDPSEVRVGDSVTLNIEINAPCEIFEPQIEIIRVEGLDIDQEPKLPDKILQGRRLDRYQYQVSHHGKINAGILLKGIIDEIAFGPEEVSTATLKKLPLTPEIRVSSLNAQYDQNFLEAFPLTFDITNVGAGAAQNVELKGIDSTPEFEILAPTKIGTVAPHGNVRFSVSLKPKRSGKFQMENLLIYYEDLIDQPLSVKVPTFDINVTALQPKIKIDILAPQIVYPKRTFTMSVRVTNRGDGDAKSIVFTVPIDRRVFQGGNVTCNISKLRSGQSDTIPFQLEAPDSNNVRINDFELTVEDAEGKSHTEEAYGIEIPVEKGYSEIPTKKQKIDWPFNINSDIGGYRILEEIGDGGYSKVYRVRREQFNEENALKALKPEFVDKRVVVENFIQEAKTMKGLKEDHIVSVEYVATVKNSSGIEFPFIIMEYMKGGTLKNKLNPTLKLMDASNVIDDVCSALKYAHQNGIVHFDVKPSNIFYDVAKDRWKLGDFGLARVMRAGEASDSRGTRNYMAPELRKNEGSWRSDIYSLGKVFTEVLTGSVDGEVRKVKVRSENEGKLKTIAALIDKMVNQNPADRPSITEIQKVLNDSGTW
jgi:tRNA A-37 threonylcarbamoyl transferase component Bud32